MLLLRLNPPGLWQEIWQSKYSTDFQNSFLLAAEWLSRDAAAAPLTFCDSYPNLSPKSFAQEKVQQFVSGFIAFSCLAERHLSSTTQQDKTAHIQFKLDRWTTSALAHTFLTLLDCMWHGTGSRSPEDRCWEKSAVPRVIWWLAIAGPQSGNMHVVWKAQLLAVSSLGGTSVSLASD